MPLSRIQSFKKGFTLIELLIVVAIIGILAGVGIPMYQDYILTSKVNRVKYSHSMAVDEMRNIIVSCSTKGAVKLITGPDKIHQTFQCSDGTDKLRRQFVAHFYWLGFRNPFDEEFCCAIGGDSRTKGYMFGYSCSNGGGVGRGSICNETPKRMWLETNFGPEKGGPGSQYTTARTYFEID